MPDTRLAAIAALAVDRGATLGTVESCTSGLVVNQLAQGEGASAWLAGGLVTYTREAKERVLGIDATTVVSAGTAAAMVEAGAHILGSDITVSVTGAAGPDPQDGEEPGTIWLGIRAQGRTDTELLKLDGDPEEVLGSATRRALDLVLAALDDLPEDGSGA